MAQFEHHDGGQTRYYECPKCRQYAITEIAFRHLKQHPESKPKLAKQAAAMPYGTVILKINFLPGIGIVLEKVSRTKYSN